MSVYKGKEKEKEDFIKKLNNIKELEDEISQIFNDEYNENFEEILLKKDSDFMRYISDSVKIILDEKYPNDAFENEIFQKIFKSTERNLYIKNYLIDKENLINTLKIKNKQYIENGQIFSSLKHCRLQSVTPIHNCNENNNFIKVSEPNSNKIYSLICSNCLKCYKIDFIKLYCDFCQVNYYTKLIENEEEDKIENNIQPATWEKYHCRLMVNEQMGCIKCKKSNLYLNVRENKLFCKKCGFISEPKKIIWTCLKCNQDFHSNAKIYNPLIFKTLSLTIKKGIINHISALPSKIPCGHNPNLIHHKKDCSGNLFLTYYNGRKLVICDKCKSFIKYKKFIFECEECHLRFRIEISEKEILDYEENEKNKKEEEKKMIDNFYKNIILNELESNINKEEISVNDNTDNINTKDSLEQNNITPKKKYFKEFSSMKENDNILEFNIKEENSIKNKSESLIIGVKNCEKKEIKNEINSSEIIEKKSKTLIPFFDINDYEIISQIGESKNSKIYCVRKINDNTFYTIKKKFIKSKKDLDDFLNIYEFQYSFSKEENITKILGVYFNEEEINILTECGISSWESEILSYRKMKKFYSEKELINIIYQISLALANLEKKKISHFCINPNNITVFKDNIYKIADFEYLTNLSSKKIVQNENKFISPNLNSLYHSKDSNGSIDLIKNDVFSLGLCCIYALNYKNEINNLYADFINVSKVNNIEKNIKKYVNNIIRLSENLYSDKFINLLYNMMNIDEIKRFNFINIINYILKEYKFDGNK